MQHGSAQKKASKKTTGLLRRHKVATVGGATGAFLLALAIIAQQSAAFAATPVNLGTAASYSVLAGTTVTNTGPTTLQGDLGVSPGTAITGFPPGVVAGATHAADAVALQAQSDLTIAYNDAASQPLTTSVSGDLVGRTLTEGVYRSTSSLALSGQLTLDGQGNPNSVFVFQVASTLITASASSIILTNSAQACNVFWQVGSSATLGTASSFKGTILALTSITVQSNARVEGRALARNGQVSLDTNVFTIPACVTTPTTSAPPTTAVPTETATATPTLTPTETTTATPTLTPTETTTATPTLTPTETTTATATATATETATQTATATATATETATQTATATETATKTAAPQVDETASAAPVPAAPLAKTGVEGGRNQGTNVDTAARISNAGEGELSAAFGATLAGLTAATVIVGGARVVASRRRSS
jgi:type VI secretion system secreted protein VgrG